MHPFSRNNPLCYRISVVLFLYRYLPVEFYCSKDILHCMSMTTQMNCIQIVVSHYSGKERLMKRCKKGKGIFRSCVFDKVCKCPTRSIKTTTTSRTRHLMFQKLTRRSALILMTTSFDTTTKHLPNWT